MTDEQVLGHADECDGIEEFDNPSPTWLNLMFLGTFVYAIFYFGWWHVWGNRSQAALYDAQVAAAEAAAPPEAKVALEVTPETVAAGQKVYTANCQGCHAADLTGATGPNLVDETWIHGGALEEIQQVIANGVASKGMPGWKPIIGEAKVNQVAAFVYDRSHQP